MPAKLQSLGLTTKSASVTGNETASIIEASVLARSAGRPAAAQRLKAMADAASRSGRHGDATSLLVRALAADPGFDEARFGLASILYRQARFEAALAQVDRLLAREPARLSYLSLKASALARLGCYQAAIDLYRPMLRRAPNHARLWLCYGQVLRAAGRGRECIEAYRKATAHDATLGDAWWALADLKTFRFEAADIAAMQAALKRDDLRDDSRTLFHMALGKAQEDAGQYGLAFAQYAMGNAARRAQVGWDGDANHAHVLACERSLTSGMFAGREGSGCDARDPIFVVGLPRAGSTLIEQILASHSRVEGTLELPDLGDMARRLCAALPGHDSPGYLDAIATLPASRLAALGKAYIERTRRYRKTKKPLFVDKMPDNFKLVGLIHLILPNATVIDARRHPIATCFSAWKQHFIKGQTFTYDLRELGRYYRDYVRLMDHFDHVLPGKVLRVFHEDLVTDTEAQVRRLLDHCGLAFEPECLAFHENPRPVRTASSEQVRRPISRDGLDHWRRFEPWLGELTAELDCLSSGRVAAARPGDSPDLSSLRPRGSAPDAVLRDFGSSWSAG